MCDVHGAWPNVHPAVLSVHFVASDTVLWSAQKCRSEKSFALLSDLTTRHLSRCWHRERIGPTLEIGCGIPAMAGRPTMRGQRPRGTAARMHEQVDYQAWKHYPEQALQGYPPYHWQAGPTLPMPSGVPSLEAKPKMFEPNAFNHASKLSASTTATGGLLEDEVEARPQLPHGLLDDDDDDIPAPRPGLGQSGRGHELLTPGPPLPLQATTFNR
eukprot:s1942_g5.t1